MELKSTEYEKLLSKQVFLFSNNDVFFSSGASSWMKQLLINKILFVRRRCSFSNEPFTVVAGVKKFLEQNSVRRNLFINACFCWNA